MELKLVQNKMAYAKSLVQYMTVFSTGSCFLGCMHLNFFNMELHLKLTISNCKLRAKTKSHHHPFN